MNNTIKILQSYKGKTVESGFDVLWLGNPFEEYRTVSIICTEISKEEFEKITSPFNSLINEAKQILK